MSEALIARIEEVISAIELQIATLEAQGYSNGDLYTACEARLQSAKDFQ